MTDYALLIQQLLGLAKEDPDAMPLLANASALLYDSLEEVNWAGFYLWQKGRLTLGPFQGKVACIHIEKGKGVCGTALLKDEVQRVEDVHAFPGHIAYDSASRSEIVLPLHKEGKVFGVLDIDSPILSRFSPEDEEGLRAFASALEEVIYLA